MSSPSARHLPSLDAGGNIPKSTTHPVRFRSSRAPAVDLAAARWHALAMPIVLSVRTERFALARTFTISRGAKREAVVVVAELSDGSHRGRGECVPYGRYGETVEGVAAAIEAMAA